MGDGPFGIQALPYSAVVESLRRRHEIHRILISYRVPSLKPNEALKMKVF